jgi:hypothetical protein
MWNLVFSLKHENWILPKEINANWMGLSLAGNLEKPLMSIYGTEWRECGYGLCRGGWK